MASSSRRVTLAPKAGFVIKTTNEIPGTYNTPPGSKEASPSAAAIHVPKGFKIFLNMCWDTGVPPPPDRPEEEIRRAMMGEDFDIKVADGSAPYFVPMVVSDGRQVNDKAGKPSLVFDCVFNSSLKSRATKDYDYRAFLIELALERVEVKSGLTLGREIATPNIASKGPLEPRTVLIPMLDQSTKSTKPLIEEVAPTTTLETPGDSAVRTTPKWTSSADTVFGKPGVRVTIDVPGLTKQSFSDTTLDVEPHRILFRSPKYELDLRLSQDMTFRQVLGRFEDTPVEGGDIQAGKGLDVDGAIAEWRIEKAALVIRSWWS